MSGYYNVLMSNHVLSVVGPSVVETENSSIGESPGKMPFEDKRSNWSYAESPDIPAYVYRWTSAYMALVGCFGIISNLLVIVGFLLALFGMGVRGAIVPGDYAGWSTLEVLKDQVFFAVLMGGASTCAGLLCILQIGK